MSTASYLVATLNLQLQPHRIKQRDKFFDLGGIELTYA